jgi:hypothetical protein
MKAGQVHMFWAEGPLPRLARLSLASFRASGFDVTLWSFTPGQLAGTDAGLRDAREITTDIDISSAPGVWLSNHVRYELLARHGGLWSDMDVVALAGPYVLPEGPFVASERRRPFRHREQTATGEGLTQVTNCFMCNPAPAHGGLFARLADATRRLDAASRDWENSGPPLMARLMLADPDHGVAILPPETADPVAWWNVPAYFLEARDPPSSPFVHMYASVWKKRGVDGNGPFPQGSLVERLCARFGV